MDGMRKLYERTRDGPRPKKLRIAPSSRDAYLLGKMQTFDARISELRDESPNRRFRKWGTRGRLVGMENEIWTADPRKLRVANDLAQQGGRRALLPGSCAETFQSQTEWTFAFPATTETLSVATRELRRLMSTSRSRELSPIATGTPLSEPEGGHQFSNVNRVDEWRSDVGDRCMLVNELVAGQHVHVDIGDLDIALEVVNRIRPWLPVVDALLANSPFLHGRFTGHASHRQIIFARLPGFREDAEYFDSYDVYKADGLQHLREIGIDRNDLTRLLEVARPHPKYKTVEARGADVALTSDAAYMHAGLVQALVVTKLIEVADERPRDELPDPPNYYKRARLLAATHGIRGRLLDPRNGREVSAETVVSVLMSHLEPGFAELGTCNQISDLISAVECHGTGAEQQLAMWAAINLDRRRRGLAASDPTAIVAGGAMHSEELKDLTLALATRTTAGTISDASLMPEYREESHHVALYSEPENAHRRERIGHLSIREGFMELERLRFCWDALRVEQG
jgi:carboxylate-amine ligase